MSNPLLIHGRPDSRITYHIEHTHSVRVNPVMGVLRCRSAEDSRIQCARLWFARTPSALKPLTIGPKAWILSGSMLRLFVALLPTLRSMPFT